MTNLAELVPDIKISVNQVFGIDTEMKVNGFSKKNARGVHSCTHSFTIPGRISGATQTLTISGCTVSSISPTDAKTGIAPPHIPENAFLAPRSGSTPATNSVLRFLVYAAAWGRGISFEG